MKLSVLSSALQTQSPSERIFIDDKPIARDELQKAFISRQNHRPANIASGSEGLPANDMSPASFNTDSKASLGSQHSIQAPLGPDTVRSETSIASNSSAHNRALNETPEDLQLEKLPKFAAVIDTGVNIKALQDNMAANWKILWEQSTARLDDLANLTFMRSPKYETDLISQGVISLEEAHSRLDGYRMVVQESFPLVDTDDLSMDELRREHPMLFLTIMAISSITVLGKSKFSTCIKIFNQCFESLIFETMLVGNKTFELLECLTSFSIWYNSPELFHHQKVHLLISLSVLLAGDLGISRPYATSSRTFTRFDQIVRSQLLAEPGTNECRKLYLCIYCSNTNFGCLLRKQQVGFWTSYTEECCSLLEQPSMPHSMRRSALFARLNHIIEEVTCALPPGPNNEPPNVNDPRVKYLMKHFDSRLADIQKVYRSNNFSEQFETAWNMAKIYLHEIAIYQKLSEHLGRSPFSEYSLALDGLDLNEATVNSIATCYSSSLHCLEIFSSLSQYQLAIQPNFQFLRMAYVSSMIFKLRTLSLTNEKVRQICPVGPEAFNLIFQLRDKLASLSETHAYVTFAVQYVFVLNLLSFHYDRQANYCILHNNGEVTISVHSPEGPPPANPDTNVNIPSLYYGGMSANHQSSNGSNSYLLRPTGGNDPRYSESLPGSPLDILSSVAVDSTLQGSNQETTPSVTTSQPHSTGAMNNSNGPPPTINGFSSQCEALQQPQQPSNSQSQPPQQNGLLGPSTAANMNLNALRPTGSRKASIATIDFDDGEPAFRSWLMSEDIWKDIVPNVEAFTGYLI